jgi:drug/metabolite transporter (DMT)-like permease
MPLARTMFLTSLAMVAFAGNSILCRLALHHTGIDAANFTSIRMFSATLALAVIVWLGRQKPGPSGSWLSAFALFAYAAAFSFAYVSLPAATGALLLFGAVQTTMIGFGLWRGERLGRVQTAGLALALIGLTGLLLPGIEAPPVAGSLLMLCAGIAWGIYSLRGRSAGNPLLATAGNFFRTLPFTMALTLLMSKQAALDGTGVFYAILSGALTSGVGYAIWYTALPGLKATQAATVQLSVPVIAALGGILFLNEPLTVRFVLASIAILAGIAAVIAGKQINSPRLAEIHAERR